MEDFLKLSPENKQIYLQFLDSNIELAKQVSLKAASVAQAQEEERIKAKAKHRDKTASSYNLMALIAGGPVITSRDDDVRPAPNDNIVRMHSASNTTDNDKVTKSYELMRLMFGGR
jgi:hypothetical protein